MKESAKKSSTRAERVRSASKARREQERRDVREAILAVATELFEIHGYEGFSLRQVAERIGYTPTTIYLYFADKDDLLFTVADHGFAEFGRRLAEAAEQQRDPVERIAALGRAYIDFGLTQPTLYRLMFMQRGDFLLGTRSGEHKPRIASLEVLQDAVQALAEAGIIAAEHHDAVVNSLWAVVHGFVALHLSMSSRVSAEQARRQGVAAMRAIIGGGW